MDLSIRFEITHSESYISNICGITVSAAEWIIYKVFFHSKYAFKLVLRTGRNACVKLSTKKIIIDMIVTRQ